MRSARRFSSRCAATRSTVTPRTVFGSCRFRRSCISGSVKASLLVLNALKNSPPAARTPARATTIQASLRLDISPADYRDTLDFDQHAGPREMRHGDQRAGGTSSVGEEPAPQFDEAVAVARIVDEDRHGHHVGEAAAGAPQGRIDEREDRLHLRVEVAGDVVALRIACRGLAGEPDGATALRDDGGRIGARLLKLARLQVVSHAAAPGGRPRAGAR